MSAADSIDTGAPADVIDFSLLDSSTLVDVSDAIVLTVPRQIAPLSLGEVTLLRPTFLWELPLESDGVLLELCRDRACTMVIETLRALGTSVRPTMALRPRSVVFWRLRATMGGVTSTIGSPTWLFHVPAMDNSRGIDTSANAHFDVNGDGLDDVVVGSHLAAPEGLRDAGTASVFHGSLRGISRLPARVLAGVVEFDAFGQSVATAGDVNGDGYGDLVVGATGDARGARIGAGRASVFYGSATGVESVPAWVLEGVSALDRFGSSVASAGDVNRDGFGDLVIGAKGARHGGRFEAGSASVFHGSASGVNRVPTTVLEGVEESERLGHSVASAGDLNGDGFGDLVIGAPGASPSGRWSAGSANVFYGSLRGVLRDSVRVLEGPSEFDTFGFSVASAGDINGDGYGDLVVGTLGVDPSRRGDAGIASVFHGSVRGVSASPTRVLRAAAALERFGVSVASAGDVNGDGFADLVIGADGAAPGGRFYAGTASVFYGSVGGVAMSPARVLEGVGEREFFGGSVASAGDVNGDGFADLVIGAWGASPGGREFAGSASVFHGSILGVAMSPQSVLEGVAPQDWFGISVAGVRCRHAHTQHSIAALTMLFAAPTVRECEHFRYQLRSTIYSNL